MYKILFVCTGNICRSPTAEGVLRHHLAAADLPEKILVDSAGTHGYHIDEPPDMRAVKAARQRGIRIDDLRARQISPSDFKEFNLILALDYTHLRFLRYMQPDDATAEIGLFLEYTQHVRNKEVPDPYYGGMADFEYTLDLIEAGIPALIEKVKASLLVE
jgi:protein-tyrosine phosphatase